MSAPLTLSLVIVTYNRNQVLVDSIGYLLEQSKSCPEYQEFLIVDQTSEHEDETERALKDWHDSGLIRWIKLPEPDLVGAMNTGLTEARGSVLLYLDDDIIPATNLLVNHIQAHLDHPVVAAVVGQVLQPNQTAEDVDYRPSGSHMRRFLNFPFNSTNGCYVENLMAGNLSVNRERAMKIGGFDENYRPPVASRFETEFAKRLVKHGEKIWFEPSASIDHLAAKSGGTRSKGSHLSSASPRYGVGDHYYALLHGQGFEKYRYCVRRLFREIRTKFHLKHPWYIPVKFIGEVRALVQAIGLAKKPQKLLPK